MGAVVADTHAALWYLLNSQRLSANAAAALDGATQAGDPIYVASVSLVEVVYLVEKGRLPEFALERLNAALSDPASGFVTASLDLAVAQTLRHIPRDIVPDMPDRIIAATALHLHLPLVTRDPDIQKTLIRTIW
ncbi:MAG: type II toxin-antitoxin system VapC family toxin [Deltaproteobacteria bacterium]|nr:type II toxin-antitoxin system VapC family toxin [Deltaproteobacteria bacterium]